MSGVEIIQIVVAIWFIAFLAIIAVAIWNLRTAVDYHTRALYRLITIWENTDDT